MYAFLALAIALAAPALSSARDRLGYEREIDSTRYNHLPKHFGYVLSEEYLAAQKNRAKLVTKQRAEEMVAADNVILESNVVRIVRPARQSVPLDPLNGKQEGLELVRRRRGYNLENVRVPARYPYLPVPRYNRFRRWG